MSHRGADEILEIHRDVDRRRSGLEIRHRDRLRCERGCHDCCVDGITVFEVEAERIRRSHPDLLDRGEPHPPGACAFLNDSGACRVYFDRPYVCRTQGLPLRWLEEDAEGKTFERRDICPLNDTGPSITGLDPEDCWLLGPFEGRLAHLQSRADDGEMRRIPLRSLFARGAAGTRE